MQKKLKKNKNKNKKSLFYSKGKLKQADLRSPHFILHPIHTNQGSISEKKNTKQIERKEGIICIVIWYELM